LAFLIDTVLVVENRQSKYAFFIYLYIRNIKKNAVNQWFTAFLDGFFAGIPGIDRK